MKLNDIKQIIIDKVNNSGCDYKFEHYYTMQYKDVAKQQLDDALLYYLKDKMEESAVEIIYNSMDAETRKKLLINLVKNSFSEIENGLLYSGIIED